MQERKKMVIFLLCLSIMLKRTSCSSREIQHELEEQLKMIRVLQKDQDSSLFSGVFSAITAFTCGDMARNYKLFRGLSRNFIPSNIVSMDKSNDVLQQLAWARDLKGQEIPNDAHHVLFLLEADCSSAEDLIKEANKEMMFSSPFKWLVLQSQDVTAVALSKFKLADLYPDSDVLIWQQESGQLISIYKSSSNNIYNIENRGLWISHLNELKLRDKETIARRRRNLAGTHLRSCIVVTQPDTIYHLTDYQERHIDSITKCNYPWALHLVSMLNATVSFAISNTWGYQGVNGSWGGMIGMLQRGEIDFGGTGTFLLRQRIGVIQYISLSTPTGSRFIFRRPPLSSISNLFMLPFRGSVWLGICGLVLLLVFLLYPAMRVEWLKSRLREPQQNPTAPNLSDDILVIVGSVTQQGSWYEPRSVSTRVIVLMGLLAFLSLYTAYTANIVALLQSSANSINSLKDLLESPLSLAAHDNVYNRYYFKSFKDPIRRAIYEERIEPRSGKKNNWLPIEEGVERIRRGYFAFHVEPGCAYKIVQETFEEDEKCGFHEIDYLNVFDPHFIVKRRSPYLELFRCGALRLHETGMRTRELTRLYTKKPVCGSARRFLSVGLAECYGAFSTLLFGALFAVALFLSELLLANLRGITTKYLAAFRNVRTADETIIDKISQFSIDRTCEPPLPHAQ